jgi:ABC-type branched-subunit amino acid transport system substrate-binding protein
MIRLTFLARLAAVSATATLVLASCGQATDSNAGETPAPDTADTTTADTNTATSPTDETASSDAPEPTGDGVLHIGTFLPQTGDLAYLGPPEFAGVDLAIKEINEAGGVLGKPVEQTKGDSGDLTPDIGGEQVDKLLNAGSDVILGAASSSVSLSVIDKVIGADKVMFSPANTSPAFDTYDDKDLYFRTSPSDVFQGEVLANLMVEDDYNNVAILARQDSYGEGLANRLQEVLKEKGATIASYELYSADATNYTAEVNKIAASNPDAIALIAFEETTKIVPQLIAKGVGPQDVGMYFVDGNTADYGDQDFDLEGVKATFPAAAEVPTEFNKKLDDIWAPKKLKDYTYGAQSYDAVMLTALAAEAAGDDDALALSKELINVSLDGTACTTYADCLALVQDGEDIDYDGISGPVDLNDTGSVGKATIGIQLYGADNNYKQIDSVSGIIE